jgi:hypothetical protein
MFPLHRDTLQNLVCIDILQSHHHAHYTVLPLLVFFPVEVFPHPCDIVTYVWIDDDGCLHNERALISLHHGRRKSHSQAKQSLVKLFDEPESCRYDHLVTDYV